MVQGMDYLSKKWAWLYMYIFGDFFTNSSGHPVSHTRAQQGDDDDGHDDRAPHPFADGDQLTVEG
jgi:hypothetical protein